jgi:uncharacterized protein (TIGR02271 family)
MAFTQSTIVAVFRNASEAQAAVRDLEGAGIPRNDIYLESTQNTGSSTELGSRTSTHEGGVTGWFKSLFGEDETEHTIGYQDALSQGNVMLTIDANDNQLDTIADVLERHSPVDVHRENASSASTQTTTAATAAPVAATANTTRAQTGQAEAIPVIAEELKVGKRRVLRGGIRVYSRIVEQPVEEQIGLEEERVHVERRPVNRPVGAADLQSGRDQVIEVEEYAEEPVVSKSARVVEEVLVGKDATQRTETIRDSVRHTEVDVEKLPGTNAAAAAAGVGAAGTSFDDSDFRRDFQTRYGATGASYDTYAPSYQYGYTMANDPRYRGRSFNEVESDLRSDYARQNPGSTWDKVKDSVQYGWNKVTGKA